MDAVQLFGGRRFGRSAWILRTALSVFSLLVVDHVDFRCQRPLYGQIQRGTQTVLIAQEPRLTSQESAEPPRRTAAPQSTESIRPPRPNYLPPQRPIGQISIDVRSKPKGDSNLVPENLAHDAMGEIPTVHAARSDEMIGQWMESSIRRADRFAYQPLYFEEVNLERYGRHNGIAGPALSSLRFFATIPSLPYAMTVHNPNTSYTWNWPYEAGWGAPRVRELQPLQWKPSLVQAGAITGLIFVVP